MLVFPLKKQWYEKIKSGEKTIEYREVKPYWKKKTFPCYAAVYCTNILQRGNIYRRTGKTTLPL